MFHINKKIGAILALLFVIGGGWYYFSGTSTTSSSSITSSDLYTVKTGSIRNVIKLAGTTQLVQSQKLSF
jgi:multidrug efflux pump subunit AcrA (membrane-fusion protein)